MPPDHADRDEMVGSDKMVDKLTEPSQKRTYQDYWNRAYGGLLPGGLNQKGDSSAPVLPDGGDDAEPFSETPVTVVQPEEMKRPDAVPVVIFDNLSRVAGSIERYFRTYQINVGQIGTTQILDHDPRRINVIIRNCTIGNVVYLGDTESTAATGYELLGGSANPHTLQTTRRMWAITAPALMTPDTPPPVAVSILSIICEYEKEI